MVEEKQNPSLLKGGVPFIGAPAPRNSIEQFAPTDPEYIKKRRGVGIGIITRGTVPLKWSMKLNDISKQFPGGLYWKFLIVERLSWAAARSEIVRKARSNNFQWLFFIDDDVFIPDDALDLLLKSKKDIISGVYWTKSENPAPVIFKEIGEGPLYDFDTNKIIPIGGSGLGCCLINMDVFDKFDEAGIPYFVENYTFIDKDGQRMKSPIGEDHYFFMKAKEFGYQPYAHTGILCDHYDVNTNKFYPGEDIVRQYCRKELTKQGRTDVIKDQQNAQNDTSKKTIVIYNNAVPFAGDEIERRGIGGSEGDIIYLAREFAKMKKYNIHVYCQCLREGRYDDVWYRDVSRMETELKNMEVDLFISSRNMNPFKELDMKKLFKIKHTCYWAHDLAEDIMWEGFTEEVSKKIDSYVFLSNFHMKDCMRKFSFITKEKCVIIPNGVNPLRYTPFIGNLNKFGLPEKEGKQKGKVIYSSTPYRGLEVLLKIWPEIKKQVPWAELSVFSSIKVYGEFFDDSPWEDLYATAKRLEGVHYHGTVKQDRLAQEQITSELCLYPNLFPETCCVTAMECQMAGTPMITTNSGALPEIIAKGCGILINGNPLDEDYQQAFVKITVDLLKDHAKIEQMRMECLKQNYDWKIRAEAWVNIYFGNAVEPIIQKAPLMTIDWDEKYKKDLSKQEFGWHEQKFNYLKGFVRDGDSVLDVGCGLGEFSRFIKTQYKNSEVWGAEQSMFALDYCRQSDKTIFFANHPTESKDFQEKYFDVIFCSHVLEYVENKIEFIDKLFKLVKSQGQIIFVIPSKDKLELINFADKYGALFSLHGNVDNDAIISMRPKVL